MYMTMKDVEGVVMENKLDLIGAFSLINRIDNEDAIDDIICNAIEQNLDINQLEYDECLLEYCV